MSGDTQKRPVITSTRTVTVKVPLHHGVKGKMVLELHMDGTVAVMGAGGVFSLEALEIAVATLSAEFNAITGIPNIDPLGALNIIRDGAA